MAALDISGYGETHEKCSYNPHTSPSSTLTGVIIGVIRAGILGFLSTMNLQVGSVLGFEGV